MIQQARQRWQGWLTWLHTPAPEVPYAHVNVLDTNREEIQKCHQLKNDVHERNVTVGAISRVLESLQRQLGEARKDIESSVNNVSAGFGGMAQRAQKAVMSSRVGNGSESDESGLIDMVKGHLLELLQEIDHSTNQSQQFMTRLLELERCLFRIEGTIENMAEVSVRARVVALNGQIESARLGLAGAGINVVAEETKSLSAQVASTSSAIGGVVSELKNELEAVSAEMKLQVQRSIERTETSKKKVSGLLNELHESSRQMSNSLRETSTLSEELSKDISRSIVSMQFQDRVNQRICHVEESLQMLMQRASAYSTNESQVQARMQSDEWLSEIAKSYTMDSERLVTNGTGSSQPVEVELF